MSMKELLATVEKTDLEKARNLVLVDTCFLLHILEKGNIKELKKVKNLGMTSFNIDELLFIHHNLHHNLKKSLRTFLKKENFVILDVPVHPGHQLEEASFVGDVDGKLLRHIHDPSDAVLIATAILTQSDVLTRDKHHLFTVELEEYLSKSGISVYNDINNYLKDKKE